MTDDDQDFFGLLDAPEAMALLVCSMRRLAEAVAAPYRDERFASDVFSPVVPGPRKLRRMRRV